jgi:hypothetical protein
MLLANDALLLGFAGALKQNELKEKKTIFFKREYHYLAPEPFNPQYSVDFME